MKKLLLALIVTMAILFTGCRMSDNKVIEVTKSIRFENGISVEEYANGWLEIMYNKDKWENASDMDISLCKMILDVAVATHDTNLEDGYDVYSYASNLVRKNEKVPNIKWRLFDGNNDKTFVEGSAINKEGRPMVVQIEVDINEDTVSVNLDRMIPYYGIYDVMKNKKEECTKMFDLAISLNKYDEEDWLITHSPK